MLNEKKNPSGRVQEVERTHIVLDSLLFIFDI